MTIVIDNKVAEKARIVFKAIKETGVFNVLVKHIDNLLFIGDDATISELQKYLSTNHQIATINKLSLDSSDGSIITAQIQDYAANIPTTAIAVVVSVEHEADIYQQLISTNCSQRVVKLFSDVIINLVTNQDRNSLKIFSPIENLPTPAEKCYAIISTPRSGSTLLCDALASTNLAGFPKEHLREPSLQLAKHCHFSLDRYLKVIKSLHQTSNSVFGTKLISHFITRHTEASEEYFDPYAYVANFIYLIRKDKVAQAVSLFMAQTSGLWRVTETSRLSSYQQKLNLDNFGDRQLETIHQLHQRLIAEETYLEQMFEQKGISPLIIYYEDLEQDVKANILKILSYLSLIPHGETNQINVVVKEKKLRNSLSQQIADLYREKYQLSRIGS